AWRRAPGARPGMGAKANRQNSQRRRPEKLPAVALQHFAQLDFAHRGKFAPGALLLFDQSARFARRIEKQHATGVRAGPFPARRPIARHEGTGARTTDGNLVADHECDLAAEDICYLITVMMPVERALCPGGNSFLEQHDAVAGCSAE